MTAKPVPRMSGGMVWDMYAFMLLCVIACDKGGHKGNNITSSYGSSCANNGKGALNTPDTTTSLEGYISRTTGAGNARTIRYWGLFIDFI
eukprot:5987794-Pyramimonas_sp.AAC.2